MSPRVGVTLSGRYRLQRLIATGGMGQVWEAVDSRLGRRVAVKVLKQEFSLTPSSSSGSALRRALPRCSTIPASPAFTTTARRQMDGEGRTAYLVMELVNGEPLNSVLKRTGRLSLRHALDMLEQTGRALQIAHAAGLVHRDVKPGNILITPTGQVKITDFGIAKAVDAAPVTQTGMVMGTAQYIAPEQALGHDATPSSDVYSLGVVGYEVVSGKRPFTGDGALTVAMKHIKEPPPPLPSDLPPNVRELIEITLVKNPGMRYRSGGPFADAVAAVRAGRRPPRPSQSPPPGRASPAAIPSAAHTAAAAVGRPGAAAPPIPPDDGRPPHAAAAAHVLVRPARAALGRRGSRRAGDHHRGAHRHQLPCGKTHQSPPPTVTDTGTHPASARRRRKTPADRVRPSDLTGRIARPWVILDVNAGCPNSGWANPLTPTAAGRPDTRHRDDHPAAPVRPLRTRRDPRFRRHVRGSSGPRRPLAPRRCGQGAARRSGPRPQLLSALPARGAECRRAESPVDRGGVRHRRSRDAQRPIALHRDGVRRRRHPARHRAQRRPAAARGGPSRSSPTPARR